MKLNSCRITINVDYPPSLTKDQVIVLVQDALDSMIENADETVRNQGAENVDQDTVDLASIDCQIIL